MSTDNNESLVPYANIDENNPANGSGERNTSQICGLDGANENRALYDAPNQTEENMGLIDYGSAQEFISALQQQNYFDPKLENLHDVRLTRRFYADGREVQTKDAYFRALRPRELNQPVAKYEGYNLVALARDLVFAVDSEAFMPGTHHDEIILDGGETRRDVVGVEKIGDGEFVTIWVEPGDDEEEDDLEASEEDDSGNSITGEVLVAPF